MMRGPDHGGVAVREPAGSVYVESHAIESVASRHPIWRKPFLRGIIVLGQSLSIGIRALMIATNHAVAEEEQLSSRQIGVSLTIAMVLFIAIFILGPTTLFAWAENHVAANAVLVNVAESIFRVALIVGDLWLIGRTKDIRRVFEHHGAEHNTIAAFEHDDDLIADRIDRFPKEHV